MKPSKTSKPINEIEYKTCTKRKAKKLSLQVWEFLRMFPEKEKENLPAELFNKIKKFPNYCPMCAYFNQDRCKSRKDELCPLWDICGRDNVEYAHYVHGDSESRVRVALKIFYLVQNWKIESTLLNNIKMLFTRFYLNYLKKKVFYPAPIIPDPQVRTMGKMLFYHLMKKAACTHEEKKECHELIRQIINLAELSKIHGWLALENEADKIPNQLFHFGLKMIADGWNTEEISRFIISSILAGQFHGIEMLKRLIIHDGIFMIMEGNNAYTIIFQIGALLGENHISELLEKFYYGPGRKMEGM